MVLKGATLLVLMLQHDESVQTSDTYHTCSQLYDVWCSNKIPLLVLLQHGESVPLRCLSDSAACSEAQLLLEQGRILKSSGQARLTRQEVSNYPLETPFLVTAVSLFM